MPPVCDTCNDTHRMELRDRMVPCTRCPLPCEQCRYRSPGAGAGAYCATTPCGCRCHSRIGAAAQERGARRNPHKGPRWWLEAIEALQAGDACETKCYSTAQWFEGTVVHNGGAGSWVIEVRGDRWHRHIEEVRCVGQTEAWAR